MPFIYDNMNKLELFNGCMVYTFQLAILILVKMSPDEVDGEHNGTHVFWSHLDQINVGLLIYIYSRTTFLLVVKW